MDDFRLKNVDELEITKGYTNYMSESLPKEDIISEIEEVGGGESAEHVLDVENDLDALEDNDEGYDV